MSLTMGLQAVIGLACHVWFTGHFATAAINATMIALLDVMVVAIVVSETSE